MKVHFEQEITLEDFFEAYIDTSAIDNGWYAFLEACIEAVGMVHDKVEQGIKGHEESTLQEYDTKVLAPLKLAMKGLRDID